jgi:ATP-dependent RNA helicase DeaD
MSFDSIPITHFEQLSLSEPLIKVLKELGYETPSPIQAQTIPYLLEGRDVIGQAQTGTGKTAAFALPILSDLKPDAKKPQVLVLAPTRELAIQVSVSFERYASHIKNFRKAVLYGGTAYHEQLQALRGGAQVVVGTPGRIIDHIKKGTLDLSELKFLVFDEADEMLRMGFIDDVEWILTKLPKHTQKALFSATMPKPIADIAARYLKNPAKISVQLNAPSSASIRQRYLIVPNRQKMEVLKRLLQVEQGEGIIIFARSKVATLEIAENIADLGFPSAALNGDIPQHLREQTVERLKSGKIKILVATDVAARGLDIDRITHVINYDVPFDAESYIHRIGRTGRAGRSGEAILFIAPAERRHLNSIERLTKQRLIEMSVPSIELINEKRVAQFKEKISQTLKSDAIKLYLPIIEQYLKEQEHSELQVCAALAKMLYGTHNLLLTEDNLFSKAKMYNNRSSSTSDSGFRKSAPRRNAAKDQPMISYRIEVGSTDGVQPRNIVGAIANEINLSNEHIGRINIHKDHSTVDLPTDINPKALHLLEKVWVSGKQLKISVQSNNFEDSRSPKDRAARSMLGNKSKKQTYTPRRQVTGV